MSIQQPQSSIPTAVEQPPGPNHNRLGSSGTSTTTTTTTMADEGGHVGPADQVQEQQHFNGGAEKPRLPRLSTENLPELDQIPTLMSPRVNTMNPFRPTHTSLEIDDYFVCCHPRPPSVFTSQSTNTTSSPYSRLDPETPRSTQNGLSSCRCTAVSCPR